jgi:hypothetical protein
MLIKYVRSDGTGDYSHITTAFDDMLVSGLAASGAITEYSMIVDGGSYSGTISGYIPYSGIFNIVGSGTYWCLVSGINSVSGSYPSLTSPNLSINNFTINCSGLPSYWLTIPSGFGTQLSNIQLLNDISGIINNGVTQIYKTESCGISGLSNNFLVSLSGNINTISDSSISNYGTGVYSKNISITKSVIHDNYLGIYYGSGHNIDVGDTLFYDNIIDINVDYGNLYISSITANSPIYINDTLILADRMISNSSINISGLARIESKVENSCLYPGSNLHSNISGNYNINLDPKFNDPLNRDYRLQFKQTEGSPCVEVKPNLNLDSSISFNVDSNKLKVYDDRGILNINEFLTYIYTQDDTFVLSDYNKEFIFADKFALFNSLRYELFLDMLFDEINVLALESFNSNVNIIDNFAWDWDSTEIPTTEIKDYNTYIIPRSIVNIESIITSKIGILPDSVSYKDITKENIKAYIKSNYRGIAYDYNLSLPGQNIIWLIDGNNQSLIKQNIYTGEQIDYYPLLCSSSTKTTIRPSGLIYTGVRGDYYTFIKQDNPNIEVLGLTDLGDFYWISTNINTKIDFRGLKSHKDIILVTAGQYPTDIIDRTVVPTGEALGKIFQYNNNDSFFNYIKYPEENNGPQIYDLASGNYYPTDITIYEDGTLFIADYFSLSGIYKYNLSYDYCLISNSYDNETKVLLRENYDNVEI